MLVLFVVICFGVSAVGAQFQPGEWYQQLYKSPLTPPNWIFAPVWAALYLAMAVAAWLVWRSATASRILPLSLFGLQLFLNAIWSWLFFGLHEPGLAFIDIILVWCAIVATAVAFWKVNTVAGVLFLPYIAWVSFAGYLNFEIWRLNP
jgi:tryptophan-rich sensory protein